MILQGNQRGGGSNLAHHLLKDENEHVEVYDLRGFVSPDLHGAFKEAYAASRATKAKQFLFSLSLSPPPSEKVPTEVFEDTIARVEQALGLTKQPRAIVFHEKEGRRHAHAVWSRIDAKEGKAVQLSFSKRKLMDISRELFLEHGWKMPSGLMRSEARDPKNFTLAQWQQAQRNGKDPREIKQALQECWAISDTKSAF
ncbi:MAG: relaxase/mobilization nuclease domain-containing protein, partial [Pseudomonadota bacterium]